VVRAQLPSSHAELALPALPDAPAGGRALLGLPTVEHELRDMRPLPALGGAADRRDLRP
jgi:hypothetical protein